MTASLTVAAIWVVLATLIALAPRRIHWPCAYGLAIAGIPLLGWITYQNGPVWGLVALGAGASILRWPLVHLFRRISGRSAR